MFPAEVRLSEKPGFTSRCNSTVAGYSAADLRRSLANYSSHRVGRKPFRVLSLRDHDARFQPPFCFQSHFRFISEHCFFGQAQVRIEAFTYQPVRLRG